MRTRNKCVKAAERLSDSFLAVVCFPGLRWGDLNPMGDAFLLSALSFVAETSRSISSPQSPLGPRPGHV